MTMFTVRIKQMLFQLISPAIVSVTSALHSSDLFTGNVQKFMVWKLQYFCEPLVPLQLLAETGFALQN